MPSGIPLTYETMLPEISSTHCKIHLPGLPDDIKSDKRFLKSRLDVLPLERKTKKKGYSK